MTSNTYTILCIVGVLVVLGCIKFVKRLAKLAIIVVSVFLLVNGAFTEFKSSNVYANAQQYATLAKEYSSYIKVSNSKAQINVNGTWINISDIQEINGSLVDSVNSITVNGEKIKINDSQLKVVLEGLKE